MDYWDRHANWERDVLEHIVALLFALAGLAEMAGALPVRRRLCVLGILARGEAAARAFLMAPDTLFGDATLSREDLCDPSDVPAEPGYAAKLAARFRTLAVMLIFLLARSALSKRPGAIAGGHRAARQGCRQATSPAPDTS